MRHLSNGFVYLGIIRVENRVDMSANQELNSLIAEIILEKYQICLCVIDR